MLVAHMELDAIKKKQFLWGVLLAWSPLIALVIPFVIVAIDLYRTVSTQKATGMGAVAGGLSEMLVSYAFIATITVEIAAIVLLVRAFPRGRPVRAFFSVVSICFGILVVGLLVLSFWMAVFGMRR